MFLLVLAHLGSPRQRAIKGLCVCVCVFVHFCAGNEDEWWTCLLLGLTWWIKKRLKTCSKVDPAKSDDVKALIGVSGPKWPCHTSSKRTCLEPVCTRRFEIISFKSVPTCLAGSVAKWLVCWTQAQKVVGSNRSSDAVGLQS